MNYAAISNGTVSAIYRVDPYSIFDSNYANTCIEASEDVQVGWSLVNGILTAPVGPTIEQIKNSISEKIKTERDRRRFDGGVKVGDYWFLSTAIAQNEYNSMMLLFLAAPNTKIIQSNWRTMSKVETDMTAGLVKQILASGLANIVAIDKASIGHINALFASTDPQNYDYSTGWPEMFVAS